MSLFMFEGIKVGLDVATFTTALGAFGGWYYTRKSDAQKQKEKDIKKNIEAVWDNIKELDILTMRLIYMINSSEKIDFSILQSIKNTIDNEIRLLRFKSIVSATKNINKNIEVAIERLETSQKKEFMHMMMMYVYTIVILFDKILKEVQEEDIVNNYIETRYGLSAKNALVKYKEFKKG